MRIQDVMTKKVVRIGPKTTVSAAREALRTDEIGHLLVVEGKRIAGVVTGSDLEGFGDDQPVETAMTRDVVTIEPDATLRHAAGVLRGRDIGCLPVVDDDRVVGIVTTSDLLTALAKGDTHTSPPNERVVLRKRGPRKRPSPPI